MHRLLSIVSKRSGKMIHLTWHDQIPCTIVRALCFAGILGICEARAEEPAQEASIRDLKQATARAERQSAEANAELVKLRGTLQDVRRRFADQYLENRELQDRLTALRWAAANLLQAQESREKLPSEATLLRQLNSRRQQQRELHEDLVKMADILREAKPAAASEGVMRRELQKRLERAIETSRQLAHQPPAVAGQGGEHRAHDVHVLTVNDELQAVIVNRGRTDGITVGSEWTPTDAPEQDLVLKIVETGDQFSVAAPLQGALRAIGPGSSLTKKRASAGSARPQ